MTSRRPSRRSILLAGAGGLAVAAALPGLAHAANVVEPDIDSTQLWNARPPAGIGLGRRGGGCGGPGVVGRCEPP
ncbi:hypothetical protein [Streptomyces hypolithicus]